MNCTPPKQYFLSSEQNCREPLVYSLAFLATTILAAAFAVTSANIAFCQEGVVTSVPVKVAKDFTPLLGHWEKCSFGGDGGIYFTKTDSGGLDVEMFAGDPLTGIRWASDFPKENYELRLEARRMDGFDFFAAVTFPVGKEYCSFVLGGWGGGMVGISSIDGADASTNETTQYKEFETGKWYTIRIRVDEVSVRCWIDDVPYATVPRHKHELTIRLEMDPCLPVGIASYMTRSELRKIELRKLDAQDAEKPAAAETQPGSEKAPGKK